jgi:hypothetical protein
VELSDAQVADLVAALGKAIEGMEKVRQELVG